MHPLKNISEQIRIEIILTIFKSKVRKGPSFKRLFELSCVSLSIGLTKGDDVKDNNVKIFIAEFIGTMVLVFGGCGTAVLATGGFPVDADGAGLSVGVLGVALAFGLTLLCMAYAIGPISGCHINPAVTLGLVVAKKVKAGMMPIYWSAQVTGGIVGALFIKIIASGAANWKMPGEVAGGFATNGFGKLSPGGFSLGAVITSEILLTALFVLVVIHTTRKDFASGFGGITAGLMLTLVHLISIPVSNTSVNPARSFGVAIIKGGDALSSQVWVFILFPLIGAAIAGIIAHYVLTEPKKVEVVAE